MYIKSEAELVYVGQGVADNGSPVILETTKKVRVSEAELFSRNYYDDQQRNMRISCNLVVPTYLTSDFVVQEYGSDVWYELMYVVYHNKKYKVRNILKVRGTRQQMILDIQEVR